MFELGDKIVYGFEGVFCVSEYTASPIDKSDERVFYILRPVMGSENNLVVTPSEGGVTPMRAIMSRDEALALIERVGEIGEVVVENERGRRDAYREVLGHCRGEDFVSLIKTVRRRRRDFLAMKRRMSETDTDFESRAKNCLYSELAVVLEITRQEAEAMVLEKLG